MPGEIDDLSKTIDFQHSKALFVNASLILSKGY